MVDRKLDMLKAIVHLVIMWHLLVVSLPLILDPIQFLELPSRTSKGSRFWQPLQIKKAFGTLFDGSNINNNTILYVIRFYEIMNQMLALYAYMYNDRLMTFVHNPTRSLDNKHWIILTFENKWPVDLLYLSICPHFCVYRNGFDHFAQINMLMSEKMKKAESISEQTCVTVLSFSHTFHVAALSYCDILGVPSLEHRMYEHMTVLKQVIHPYPELLRSGRGNL